MNGLRAVKLPAALAGAFAVAGPMASGQGNSQTVEERLSALESKGGSGLSSLGSMFTLYGYLRVDAIRDDSRPNNTQLPAFIRSEDPTAPAAFGAKSHDPDFNLHPKLTRVGLDFKGPQVSGLGDPKLTGKLETDFYNATATESREALRIRVAYLQLTWNNFAVYGGQMWDVISPLFPIVNPDLVMWGAGNLADRRPQIRGEWWTNVGDSKLTLTGMLGATSAVDAQDLDANTYRDGDASARPTLQARAGWKTTIGEKQQLDFGIWAHNAAEQTDTAFGTTAQRNFDSSAYGIDLTIPIYQDVVWVKGELWTGRNLDDVRGGILQGINSAGQEIKSRGGFGEIGFKATDHTRLYAGWSFDDPDNDDLIVSPTNAPRSRNAIAYAAAEWEFKPVKFGLHYLRWTTGYKGFDDGDDNRFQFYAQYSF